MWVFGRIALWSALCAVLVGCSPKKAASPGSDAGARPVPVLLTTASARDVPIYLDGLGTVVAGKTVTVRSQVDGKLVEVLFKEGQAVKRGQLLARIDSRPFATQWDQAHGALLRDRALLSSHQKTLGRLVQLREQNHIPQQTLEDEQALVGQYQGAVAIDLAQLSAARLGFSYTKITSPIDGIVGVRLVDEGNLIRQSDANGIVVVTQLDPISVLFSLSEDELPRILARMREGPIPVEIYHRQGETRLGSGQLLALDNQINQATAMIRLKATVPNAQGLLWPNQFVKVRLLLRVRKAGLLIAAAAVQRGPKGPFVYVVQKGDTAVLRPIAIEAQLGDQVLIAEGVTEGERVVLEGHNQLRPGAKVTTERQGEPTGPGPSQKEPASRAVKAP